MMTFKQLEAIYWAAHLGGFAGAAQKLHTTQSAVSKRIHELEALCQAPLFERSKRAARLTPKGEEVVAVAARLLKERDELMKRTLDPSTPERRLRIGVTEVTAMTWLPRFVERIHEEHPSVVIHPEVDSGARLRDKLLANEIDLMIAADTYKEERFKVMRVGKLRLQWMCKRGLVRHDGQPLRVQALHEYPVLSQGSQSGVGLFYADWLKGHGVKTDNLMLSNNLIALIGLTLSGFGVSYLPLAAVQPMIDQGLLEVLVTRPVLPDAPYSAVLRRDNAGALMMSVVRIARETCDFSRLFQTTAAESSRGKCSA